MENQNTLLYDLHKLLGRAEHLEETTLGNNERMDVLFENLGELNGQCDSVNNSIDNTKQMLIEIISIKFNKSEFYNKLTRLSSEIDTIFSRIDFMMDEKIKTTTSEFDSFLKRTNFIDIFEDTYSLFREAKELEKRLNLQKKNLDVVNYNTLHRKMFNLLNSLEKVKEKIDALNNKFSQLNKGLSSLEHDSAILIENKTLHEEQKKIINDILAENQKWKHIANALAYASGMPPPNYLFVGQSLHNYISEMLEHGYRNDYIIDFLSKQGVDQELVKIVLGRIGKN